MGFREELEQGREGGETALACLHTAGSCREHGCCMPLLDWQGLRNVVQVPRLGLDCQQLPQAHQNSAQPGSALKSWCSSSVHIPSILQCWQHSGVGHWEGTGGGSMQDASCPSPMNTSSWECGIPGFGGPLALLCFFPCYQNGRWRLCSCREGCRKVQLLWGRSNPHLPNQGTQSRVGQSSGAGACTGPENNLHICLQLLCPLDLPT